MSKPPDDPLADWAARIAPKQLVERTLLIADKATALCGIYDDPVGECDRAVALARKKMGLNGDSPTATTTGADDDSYRLRAVDWTRLLAEGVPEVEYLWEPYFPKGARIWIWGATGSYKSLFCEWAAANLSRGCLRVSYFSEENPMQEELRRLAKVRPDPEYFRLFHRTGMDLTDPAWVESFLSVTRGDAVVFLDSWTDLWGGDEKENREVQQFDARVLKPMQAQGATPVVLHHTGHRQMFSDRGGATAGRGASALGQKADVTLEFKDAGEDRFTIIYGKCRIGGVRVPERAFRVEDEDDGTVSIIECGDPGQLATNEMVEKMVRAIVTATDGSLTTSQLRAAVGGSTKRQTEAFERLADDIRVHVEVEKVRTKDGKFRDANVWRPAAVGVEYGLP